MRENIHTHIEKIENQSLKNKKLLEAIEHEISRYIQGSADAKATAGHEC